MLTFCVCIFMIVLLLLLAVCFFYLWIQLHHISKIQSELIIKLEEVERLKVQMIANSNQSEEVSNHFQLKRSKRANSSKRGKKFNKKHKEGIKYKKSPTLPTNYLKGASSAGDLFVLIFNAYLYELFFIG